MKTKKYNLNDETWFQQQRMLLAEIEAPHPVDVVDKVMEQVAHRPFLMPEHQSFMSRHKKVVSIAAACIVAVVVCVTSFSQGGVQAANSSVGDLSQRVSEIYEFCDCYTQSNSNHFFEDNPLLNNIESVELQ